MHIKSITSQSKLHVYCKHGFGLYTRGSFICIFLDDLDNISILLDEDNDLDEEITRLFNEVFLFSGLKKNPQPIGT